MDGVERYPAALVCGRIPVDYYGAACELLVRNRKKEQSGTWSSSLRSNSSCASSCHPTSTPHAPPPHSPQS
eukprot:3177258-Rhodomonas_salina.1